MKAYEYKGYTILADQAPEGAKEIAFGKTAQADTILRLYEGGHNDPSAYIVNRPQFIEAPHFGVAGLMDKGQTLDSRFSPFAVSLAEHRIVAVNTSWEGWEYRLNYPGVPCRLPARVQIIGMGDVGHTCLIALRLMGSDLIGDIGIYDVLESATERWAFEMGQCVWSFPDEDLPTVHQIKREDLFRHVDIVIFAAARGVPAPGEEAADVRKAQYQHNAPMVAEYAKLAREQDYQGMFIMLSDPVERLAQVAWRQSNLNEQGEFDGKGLRPEQVEGYGLGVMHARAGYVMPEYIKNGRAFGRHGDGLILANDIAAYDDALSQELSARVASLNMDLRRRIGYKPFVGPAVSSGALTLLSRLRGTRHYSAVFMDGVYYGAPLRTRNGLPALEYLPMDPVLCDRLKDGVASLKAEIEADGDAL